MFCAAQVATDKVFRQGGSGLQSVRTLVVPVPTDTVYVAVWMAFAFHDAVDDIILVLALSRVVVFGFR